MMVKEEEAKKLWCPMVRTGIYAGDGGVAINHHVNEEEYVDETRCKASKCMMWRWRDVNPTVPARIDCWPKTDDESVLITKDGPIRPTDGAYAVSDTFEWIPMTGDDDDFEGGYWQEPSAEYEARKKKVVIGRRGYCGIAGRLEVE